MKKELTSSFQAGSFEQSLYKFWLENGYFTPEKNSSKEAFSIVIPPPNVTGKLHMGHALVNTLQDVIVRFKRMKGYNVLWLPGTDHAGIATQMVVERELAKEKKTKYDLGREEFLKIMWEWKEKYKDNIKNQLQMLGCSCDWTRERFTLDEGLSKAVRFAFVKLYKENLIYRDYYIVNWCPRCRTALSDLEVVHKEVKGKLYHILYPFKEREGGLVVATTRPETMLGDSAVAVNPKDERYKKYIGEKVILPLVERELPIIADENVDLEFGTGSLKVTPAHDPVDFIIGKKHNLNYYIIFDEKGVITKEGGPYEGLDRFEGRRKILEDLKDKGFLIKIEDHLHKVGHCQRCETMIEPYFSRQWFLKMDEMAREAIKVVKNGDLKITPSFWEKTYFEWLENIHDWCISRQLWWGHRIPAFYCSCGNIIVEMEDPDKCPKCGSNNLKQDEDVLDTWFSSALWPFSTMGWPSETDDLKNFYPTSLLITGFDILFFWVARMVMMALKFTGKIPFKEVYLNGLVRDSEGEKMAKTRGNVIDPEEVCKLYGPDAVRFTLTILTSYGRDIPLSYERMEGYKNFMNKLWNASRFVFSNLEELLPLDFSSEIPHLYILSKLQKTIKNVLEAFDFLRFDILTNEIYHFVWHEFCDWYIEISKFYLKSEKAKEAQSVLFFVLQNILKLLHPIVPFITEEIWQKIQISKSITFEKFPEFDEKLLNENAENSFEKFKVLISKIRSFRKTLNLEKRVRLEIFIKGKEVHLMKELIEFMENVNVNILNLDENFPEGFKDIQDDWEWVLKIQKEFLSDLLIERIKKEFKKLNVERDRLILKLNDKNFKEKAKEEVVNSQKERLIAIEEKISFLSENLKSYAK